MQILIYTDSQGHTATLATLSAESPVVLNIGGEGDQDLPGFGPADTLPWGMTAAALVRAWATGARIDGRGGTFTRATAEGVEAARSFLAG
jgi:hypothetical protein